MALMPNPSQSDFRMSPPKPKRVEMNCHQRRCLPTRPGSLIAPMLSSVDGQVAVTHPFRWTQRTPKGTALRRSSHRSSVDWFSTCLRLRMRHAQSVQVWLAWLANFRRRAEIRVPVVCPRRTRMSSLSRVSPTGRHTSGIFAPGGYLVSGPRTFNQRVERTAASNRVCQAVLIL